MRAGVVVGLRCCRRDLVTGMLTPALNGASRQCDTEMTGRDG